MCGRYRFDDGSESVELGEIIDQINRREGSEAVKTSGDIYPTDLAPVMANSRRRTPAAFAMRWGYLLADGRRAINARCETAAERPLFRDGMRCRRCAVPATRYYEWERANGQKTKYAIGPRDGGLFFMAGLYRMAPEWPEFVILTRDAAEGIAFIHDRMPVILPRDRVADWMDPDCPPEEVLRAPVLSMAWERETPEAEQLKMSF